jgi:pimeloyl-ACP methyl ester carboxylesterase
MRSVALAVVLACAFALGLGASIRINTASGATVPPCGSTALKRVSSVAPNRGDVPVLFVHGMAGSPAIWTKPELDGSDSIADRVSALNGATVWTFNYRKNSLEWVTDASIGPRLAGSIACLARYTGKPVVVIDHSMGGLATKYAAAQRDSFGHQVSGDIGEVIAIGTPFEGSKFLSVLQAVVRGGEALSNPGLAAAAEALLSACAGVTSDGSSPCGALAVLRSPVGSDLVYHSAAIARLPGWSASLPVRAIAGEVKITIGIWKLRHTFDLGDILVSQDSATAHNTDGYAGRVVCNVNVLKALSSDCYHARLPSNPAVVNQVLGVVRRALFRESPPARQSTTTTSPPPVATTVPPPVTRSLQIGSAFDDECVVAWPTAPVRTSSEIDLTMSCAHVPESQYQFTYVAYGDPNLAITPSTGRVRVIGKVVDVAQSAYGYKELVVEASNIVLP